MNKFFLPVFFLPVMLSAQYSFERLNNLNEIRDYAYLYDTEVDYHTSIRPLYIPEADSFRNDSRPDLSYDYKKWLWRKLFNESLVELRGKNYELTIDPVVNFRLGRDLDAGSNLYTNTRGFNVEGKLGDNFYFTSSFLENQARFPEYIADFSEYTQVIPGQGYARPFQSGARDFAMASGEISYAPNDIFVFTLGQGRNFFGEGYRSMILSDATFNYPFFRIETDFWRIKYVNLWSQMYDVRPEVSPGNVFAKKYLSTHYLSINISPRWNVSLFESLIFGDTAQQRGIDPAFFNPVILYRPVEFAVGSGTGNALLGFGTSYKILDGLQMYGQLTLDEFTAKEFTAGTGYWANKYGYQLGAKYYNAFGLEGLFLRLEHNAVTPYTFSHRIPLSNYGHYGQPLAHPWGGNFRETMMHLVFQHGRWEWEAKFNYGEIGLDTLGSDWGADIYRSYQEREQDYNNSIAQGESARLFYLLLRMAWLVNPESGLKIEAGMQWRDLNTGRSTLPLPGGTSQYVFLGLRTEFFNRYYDF